MAIFPQPGSAGDFLPSVKYFLFVPFHWCFVLEVKIDEICWVCWVWQKFTVFMLMTDFSHKTILGIC